MPATLTIPNPGTPAGKTIVPNRYPPQADGPPEEQQRFAALLQQRRDAPPATAAPQRAEAKAAAKPAAYAAGDGQASGDADRAAEATSASEATLAASTGCAAAKPRPAGKLETRQAAERRDSASIDASIPAPNAAASTIVSSSAAHDGAAGTNTAPPAADLSLWPGLPAAKVDAATTSANGALAAGNGATQELRIGAGTPGTTASGMQPTDGAAGGPGQRDTGRQDGGGADAAADQAAALLDAAASNAEHIATGNTAADRFALPRPRVPDSALPGLAGGLAPHRTDASPAATVALATPLAAPDFAKALGAQVSLFARNGLAHAELQLTPAEMGPIRVQIAIDGAHARVDFAADSAATRQVIERGLPELASALREQGLTLSGGGVFQRAPDQQRDGDEAPHAMSGRARRRADSTALEVAAVAQRPSASSVRPGGIDFYA